MFTFSLAHISHLFEGHSFHLKQVSQHSFLKPLKHKSTMQSQSSSAEKDIWDDSFTNIHFTDTTESEKY